MADSEQEQNRSEQATPFKLKEARERGMVAKSAEFNGAIATLAFIGLLYVAGRGMFERLARLDASLLSRAHRFDFSEAAALAWLSAVLVEKLNPLAPGFALLILPRLLPRTETTSLVIFFEPHTSGFDRANPAA